MQPIKVIDFVVNKFSANTCKVACFTLMEISRLFSRWLMTASKLIKKKTKKFFLTLHSRCVYIVIMILIFLIIDILFQKTNKWAHCTSYSSQSHPKFIVDSLSIFQYARPNEHDIQFMFQVFETEHMLIIYGLQFFERGKTVFTVKASVIQTQLEHNQFYLQTSNIKTNNVKSYGQK